MHSRRKLRLENKTRNYDVCSTIRACFAVCTIITFTFCNSIKKKKSQYHKISEAVTWRYILAFFFSSRLTVFSHLRIRTGRDATSATREGIHAPPPFHQPSIPRSRRQSFFRFDQCLSHNSGHVRFRLLYTQKVSPRARLTEFSHIPKKYSTVAIGHCYHPCATKRTTTSGNK